MFGKRSILPLFILVAVLLSACGGSNTAGSSTRFSGTIHIASSTWTGYALIDVAVTWEPWLSKAKARTDGHVLVSSATYPDLIMDSFAFRKDFVQKYPDTVKDFMKAYYDAYNWMQANKTEALNVIGAAVQETPADVTADLSTIKLFDLSTGKQVIGTSSSHGKIYDNVKAAADFWKAQGKIDTAVNPSDAVDPSFINSL